MKVLECGVRYSYEARRKGRGEEQEQRRQEEQEQRREEEQEQRRQEEQGQTTGQEQGKEVRVGGDEQLQKTRAESTDEPEVTGRFAEVTTGRRSTGLVRGGDERC